MKKTIATVISLFVCLSHTTGLCFASYSPPILETKNWQLETDYEGLQGGGSILANTFTFGYSDAWGWTDSTQYQGSMYDVSRFSASVAQGAIIGLTTAGLGNLAATGSTAAQIGYGGAMAAGAFQGGYQVASGIATIADGNYLSGAGQIAGGGLSIYGSYAGMNSLMNATTQSANPIQFGNNANQVSHAFRHTDALGLDRTLVQSSVQNNLKAVASQITPGQPFNQVIVVGGQRIQYTAYKLSDGTINIGRIHGVP